MNLPSKGTRGRAIADFLFVREKCRVDGIYQSLKGSIPPSAIAKALEELFDRNVIVNLTTQELENDREAVPNDYICLTEDARDALEDHAEIVIEQGEIALPSTRNVFGPELNPRYYTKVLGMRDGSNDHLNWPSKFA